MNYSYKLIEPLQLPQQLYIFLSRLLDFYTSLRGMANTDIVWPLISLLHKKVQLTIHMSKIPFSSKWTLFLR
jgi:hypothetical protein